MQIVATTTQSAPAITVRRIVCSSARDEVTFRDAAWTEAHGESLADALNRFLALQQEEEIDTFFRFFRRRAPDLIPACNWLVSGPKLARGRPMVPTFGQLQRLIQLVRERRPDLLGFVRHLLTMSVLAKVAGVQAGTATSVPSTPVAP